MTIVGKNRLSALAMLEALISENIAETDVKLVQKRELSVLLRCYRSLKCKEAIAAFIARLVLSNVLLKSGV